MNSPASAPATKLLVPDGATLTPGRLYLQLYHGCTDQIRHMDDWGFAGPTFGPLTFVVQTCLATIRLHSDGDLELWLPIHDDMIVWNGSYLGDMSIVIAEPRRRG
jgi:hypothetical protein